MSATKLEQAAIQQATLELIERLAPKVEARQELKKLIAELNAQVDALDAEIIPDMLTEGVYKVEVAGYSLSYNDRVPRESLNKAKLVELGVSTDVIKAATNKTEFSRFDVRSKGETS